MNPDLQHVLTEKLLALGDDELVLGHRDSEWAGHAPILEEDIAFGNVALDEMGHAMLWYNLRRDLTGDDPDRLVYFRDPAAYRNLQMVELPKGDWAFTIARQYLFDAAEGVFLAQLAHSQYWPLAEVAAKIGREELYHYRHSSNWVKRLGLGTAESHRRMQAALDELWPYTAQVFAPLPHERLLVEAGFVPDPNTLRSTWLTTVAPFLRESGLDVPAHGGDPAAGRDQHTEYLTPLLTDLQEVARYDPTAEW
ncbi:MAG: 1,2-phenylacetyl-CoA epoxidase subunit PaaC [Chloroflexota bacterium]